ncbi:hypothetical protein DXN05_16040 [Deminuibacter soli]|uniref:DUF4251 domain-containing protein n=1 Tax=Deminuibacter soli TaxID=2291815 RepID=A0A3E1NGL9_9BACT|nr:hypothetical protein DXN05_16040 [Deminuibacter soli]
MIKNISLFFLLFLASPVFGQQRPQIVLSAIDTIFNESVATLKRLYYTRTLTYEERSSMYPYDIAGEILLRNPLVICSHFPVARLYFSTDSTGRLSAFVYRVQGSPADLPDSISLRMHQTARIVSFNTSTLGSKENLVVQSWRNSQCNYRISKHFFNTDDLVVMSSNDVNSYMKTHFQRPKK